MNSILLIIFIPIVSGLLLLIAPERYYRAKATFTIFISLLTLLISGLLQGTAVQYPEGDSSFLQAFLTGTGLVNMVPFLLFHNNLLCKLLVIACAFFSLLVSVYASGKKRLPSQPRKFFSYLLLTLGVSNGAILSEHLLLFLFFWGILGITLYKLIRTTDEAGAAAAKKSFILIGSSDCLMILGIGILWQMNYPLHMTGIHVPTHSAVETFAFLCLLAGSFTKAGALPFHSWIPDFADAAVPQSSAFLPASLDKLLGIYFLYRLCSDMFILNDWLVLLVIIAGVCTILAGVMMALVQHRYKKLLGYHAISQVGYMVLGLGLGSPLAIAGGLFHMFNHTLYKSGLFLVAGNVEQQTGQQDIEELGGLSKVMPITYVSAVLFSLSISGVPPLNGFASKWLIYQGIIAFGSAGTGIANKLWIVWLGLAVIGSALTLASFLKFIAGIFLGRLKPGTVHAKEASWRGWVPVAVLALMCVVAGVLANIWVIPRLIMPITGTFTFPGVFHAGSLALLVLASILLGIAIYFPARMPRFRTEGSFIGGEDASGLPDVKVTDFYTSISHAPLVSSMYKMAAKKWFDIYEVCRNAVFGISHWLSSCHTGILPLYASWIFAGLIILLLILL